jgi:hypothetical protein
VLALAVGLAGCPHHRPTPRPPKPPIRTVDIDPTVIWQPVTTDCLGNPAATPAGYNVYAAPGTTLPTVPSAATELPCGPVALVDRSQVAPLNGSNLIPPSACTGTPPVCTYATTLKSGTYTVGVEAVAADGTVSGVSNTITIAVVLRPHGPTGVQVTK